MDGFTGFTGFETATTEQLPAAVPVMDPFHVVRLAGDALDRCRRRVQQRTHGHRGRAKDPLYRARRTLHTGVDLLTDKQSDRIRRLFDLDVDTRADSAGRQLVDLRRRALRMLTEALSAHPGATCCGLDPSERWPLSSQVAAGSVLSPTVSPSSKLSCTS